MVHHGIVRLPDDLETPAVVVDVERLERNLTRMADSAAAAGVALRPHAKTHKCLEIARLQLAHGATGLTVATLAEAEAFAAAGCPSVFVAFPLWAASGTRPERIRALRSHTDLRIGVDSAEAARALAAAAPGTRVLIEVDSGQHRSGILPADVAPLAADCRKLGLDVVGAFTHPGHSYGSADSVKDTSGPEEFTAALRAGVAAAVADERASLAQAGAALADVLDQAPELSGGSSPTVMAELQPAAESLEAGPPEAGPPEAGPPEAEATETARETTEPLTEVRPGTYVFGDRQQLTLSQLAVADVALVVAARVVSAPRPGQVVLDAGTKALTSDRAGWLTGHGLILEAPEATIVTLSEEHAVVRGVTTPLKTGDLVRVVPNHVCPVVNLTGSIAVVRDGEIADHWQVVARR
jgi:D-serine deaminase-like pyridoxal phosphate-dependent protein